MRAIIILAAACLISGCSYSYAFADSISNSVSLALPSASGNYAADKFDAGELRCQNAISSATTMEVGLTSIIQGSTESRGRVGDIAIYSRITFPLGARPKSRINCNLLFELELRKKQMELTKLRQEINKLKEMTFEN
jgi:hypothetical protein